MKNTLGGIRPATHVVHISHTRIQFSFFDNFLHAPITKSQHTECGKNREAGSDLICRPGEGMDAQEQGQEQELPCPSAIANQQQQVVYSVRVQFITSTTQNGRNRKPRRNSYAARFGGFGL